MDSTNSPIYVIRAFTVELAGRRLFDSALHTTVVMPVLQNFL